MSKGKSHFALTVTVCIILLALHTGTALQNPINHCRHFTTRAGFWLIIDTGRILLRVPINHNSSAFIAEMILGNQILFPYTKKKYIKPIQRKALWLLADRVLKILIVMIIDLSDINCL